MSLKPCRECGEQVSTEARTCPKCGIKNPAKKKANIRMSVWIALIATIILIVTCLKNTPQSHPTQIPESRIIAPIAQAEQQIAEAMKDPDKTRLMECTGVNPWKVKPTGWTAPTDAECEALKQKFGDVADVKETSRSLTPEIAPTPTPDGNMIGSPSEKWKKVQSGGREIYVQTNGLYSGTQFRTNVVSNMPESGIVGAPQSVMTEVEGDCAAKTFHISRSIFFAGKNRSGMAMDSSDPENYIRKLLPNSPFEGVFIVLCKNYGN